MLRKAICIVGVLCISTLLFTNAIAKDKPDKPDTPQQAECIEFVGDLSSDGVQIVEGCCPNAGPFPEFTMYLSGAFGELAGEHDGNLFINNYGVGKNHAYIVQFWWVEDSTGEE